MMSVKEKQEKLVKTMKTWQQLENKAVEQTAKIMGEAKHPLIRLVMEIIQRDSNMHHRVQQMIIDATENAFVEISPDDLVGVWDSIENHIKIEKKTIELAQNSLDALEGTSKTMIQQYLTTYLLTDEEKHDRMLADLELIKRGMFKSS
ncbi:MAG: hypothetical protein JSW39_24060 [Desulfobacterales bacterium]|nr:MAG: hypothetical protein JSW39_24060 [Desulfobacterales bacterium]